MRTTVVGAILAVGSQVIGRTIGAMSNGHSISTLLALVLGLAFLVGIGCLIVGPILWVRGARATKAEEMQLLREIAAQGRQVPPTE